MSDKIDKGSGAGPCGPCLLPLEALSPPVASTASPFRNREMMPTSPSASSAGLSIGSVSPKFQTEGSPKGLQTPGQEPLVPGTTRVAVVGAGPVGLWIAVLLARAHARFFQTSSGFRISRHPQAPVINVIWLQESCPTVCYKLPISMFEYWLVMIREVCEPEFCSRSGMKPGIKKKY